MTVPSPASQSCRFPSFQSILADQPGLTILTQVQHAAACGAAASPYHVTYISIWHRHTHRWVLDGFWCNAGLQDTGEQQPGGSTRPSGWRHPPCAHRHRICHPPGWFRWAQGWVTQVLRSWASAGTWSAGRYIAQRSIPASGAWALPVRWRAIECWLCCCTGLTTIAAQRTLAAKAQSILQYHLLDGGGYTAAELLDNAAVQSSLGRTLGRPLPLTFTAGTTRGSVRFQNARARSSCTQGCHGVRMIPATHPLLGRQWPMPVVSCVLL